MITVPSYTFVETSDENLLKVVDLQGDWTHYFIKDENRYIPSVNRIITRTGPMDPGLLQWIQRTSKEEAEKRFLKAGEQGTRSHYAIRQLIDGFRVTLETKFFNDISKRDEPLNNDEWFNMTSFVNWWATYKPETIRHEFSVVNKKLGYAGTPDWIGTIEIPKGMKQVSRRYWGKRVTVLLDWKTSSGIWKEYKLQTAAYTKTVPENIQFTGVVRIGTSHKSGWQIELWNKQETNEHFRLFKSLLKSYSFWSDEKSDYQPIIEQIPYELYLEKLNQNSTNGNSNNK